MANKKRLIDANTAMLNTYNEVWWTESEAAAVRSFLVQQKTVDAVEVVHGHWKYGTRAAVCSACGFERDLDDNFGAAIACPNCGAKMDGGKQCKS